MLKYDSVHFGLMKNPSDYFYPSGPGCSNTTVDSRYLEPLRETEKSSSYQRFELSRVKLNSKCSEGK